LTKESKSFQSIDVGPVGQKKPLLADIYNSVQITIPVRVTKWTLALIFHLT
jgi:hypothetical protein